MESVILLKTQLVEAAKLAYSTDYAHQRLAVILLDNFIEIQLSTLMKKQFAYDDWFSGKPNKYSFIVRKKVLYNYDHLLKVCISEKIITYQERDLLAFCHDVRNNLYHKAKEEHLLTTIALQFLYELIIKYQPDWKSARDFTTWDMKIKDPYVTNHHSPMAASNTKEEWILFLKQNFNCIHSSIKSPAKLIFDHLSEKIYNAKEYYQFLLAEYSNFSPSSKNWELNDFLLHYSFFIVKEFELKNLKETLDAAQYNVAYFNLIKDYQNKWKFVRPDRLDKLESNLKGMANLSSHKALEKYKACRTEVYLIFDALTQAARYLDAQIDAAIDARKEHP